MNRPLNVELQPLGKIVRVEPGAQLRDALFEQGVEFPCGGRGRCNRCRIRVLSGQLPPTADDLHSLDAREIADGWRLGCRATATSDLTIEIGQWEAVILADESPFQFIPRDGLGIAVDLGTTTIAAQLIDLRTARVLAVKTALNPQAAHGADIMSRLDFAMRGGAAALTRAIREQLDGIVCGLLTGAGRSHSELVRVIIVGNTAMHHLFCGIDVTQLARSPFEPRDTGLQIFLPRELGWEAGKFSVHFLPCLGGFVGSDILAGVLATKLHANESLQVLIDLGTNGEIIVGHRDRLLCASTAAGPAFEGARISMGMRAATGAISEVTLHDGQFACRVLGNTPPRGICGSGLVDAVSAGLELGQIEPSGRLKRGEPLVIAPPVSLTQNDVRELQFAKGAIAAGIRLLLSRFGVTPEDVARVNLAGAFGNYVNRSNARRIGLLKFAPERIMAAGNTALLGAKLALFEDDLNFEHLRGRIEHVPLGDAAEFEETFVAELGFPAASN